MTVPISTTFRWLDLKNREARRRSLSRSLSAIAARKRCSDLRAFHSRISIPTIASGRRSFNSLIYVTLSQAAAGEIFQSIFPSIARIDNILKDASQTQSLKERAGTGEMDKPLRTRKLASVRMSSGGYLAIGAVMTFAALICLRSHRDLPALVIVFTTWTTIPALMLTDRLTFDG